MLTVYPFLFCSLLASRTFQIENKLFCTKHCWSAYEQNSIVNSVDDWTDEWAIIPGDMVVLNSNISFTLWF